jgi:hypothetical protein
LGDAIARCRGRTFGRASLNNRVLVLGGYGVFGTRLCAGLVADGWDLTVAGRSLAAAQVHCAQHGGQAMMLNHAAPDFAAQVARLAPFAVIDAAGPFQAYTTPHVVQAALDAGAHYLDLSDDAGFTAAITAFDGQARDKGLVVISGVSTVPALSSAVAADLVAGLTDVHLIDSTILPGNRAPRGLSVIRAILAQVGRPLALWREGVVTVPAWGRARRVSLVLADQSLPPRPASVIGAPDLALFPAHFRARNVVFRAGLELGVMHHGLTALSWLVRLRLVRSLVALARPLQWAANLLKPFGTDQGGMLVRVLGVGPDGPVARQWTLIANGGDGPQIPAVPARLIMQKLRAGTLVPGARACLAAFSRAEAEALLRPFHIKTGMTEVPAPYLFAQALGASFAELPPAVQGLHAVMDQRRWAGQAKVTRGAGILARIVAAVMRFPPASANTPLTVTMARHGDAERWTRNFGGRRFHSTLRLRGGQMAERFGILRFAIGLHVQDARLHYPVTAGWCLGVPVPRALLPISNTVEAEQASRATFDVALSLPLVGLIVRYQGWLKPVS